MNEFVGAHIDVGKGRKDRLQHITKNDHEKHKCYYITLMTSDQSQNNDKSFEGGINTNILLTFSPSSW